MKSTKEYLFLKYMYVQQPTVIKSVDVEIPMNLKITCMYVVKGFKHLIALFCFCFN